MEAVSTLCGCLMITVRFERPGVRVRVLSGIIALRSWARLLTLKVDVALSCTNIHKKTQDKQRFVRDVHHYIPLHVQVSTMWGPDGLQINRAGKWMH